MRRSLMWFAALLCLAVAVEAKEPADPKPPPDDATSPAKLYQAIEQEFQKAQQDFSKAYQQATTDDERQKVIADKYPQPQKFADRMLELAEQHADDPAAVDALAWIVTRARTGTQADKALAILGEKHIENEKIGPVCQSLVYSQSLATEKLLRAVLEKNPHHEAQGQACYALAKFLGQQSELIHQMHENPDLSKNLERFYGKGIHRAPQRGRSREAGRGS